MTELSARRTQTRDRLIDAALTVFAEKGVGGASVEVICDAAGFTRGAFYSNFDTKDALCLAVLERQADENLAAAHEAVSALPSLMQGTFDELVSAAIAMFLSAQRPDRTWILATSELRLHAVREPTLAAVYRDFAGRVNSTFATLITETAHSLGYELTLPGEEAIAALHAVFEHGAITALIAGQDIADPDRATQLGAVLRSMLRPIGA